MKNVYTVFSLALSVLFLLVVLPRQATAQNFQWAITEGGPSAFFGSADQGGDIVSDEDGNTYVTGRFAGQAVFSGDTVQGGGSNPNTSDIFIAKYNTDGVLQWVKTAGGAGTNYANGIELDANYDLIITGRFTSQAIFDTDTVNSFGSTFIGDMFVAKYDTAGNFQWVQSGGGINNDEGFAVTSAPSGDIYVSGFFTGAATFDTVSVTSGGGFTQAMFLAKLNSAGDFLWVEASNTTGGTFNNGARGVDVDASGNIYLAGRFSQTITFDTITVSSVSSFSSDAFLAKFNSSGSILWIETAGDPTIGNTNSEWANDVVVTPENDVFITGTIGPVAAFGSITLTGSTRNIFIARYDTAGNIQDATSGGGGGGFAFSNDVNSICTDQNSDVFITGFFEGTINLGNTTLTTTGSGGAFADDIFLAKYNKDSADFVWAASAVGGGVTFQQGGNGISADTSLNVYVTGISSGNTIFGNITVNTFGASDIFVTKVGDCSYLDVSMTPSGSDTICQGDMVLLQGDTGANFGYQWLVNGSVLAGENNISYNAQTSGLYQVLIDDQGCLDTASSFDLLVNPGPVVGMSSITSICDNASPITLTQGSPSGGVYSGSGVTGTTFDPGLAGVGTHNITYTFTDGNGCADSAATSVTVQLSPFVFIIPFASVCDSDPAFVLSAGIPGGGTYSGTGVLGGTIFDPVTAGVGTHTITYTIVSGNGCSNSASTTLTVNPTPSVSLAPLPNVCISTTFIPLTGGSPSGGIYSGTGVSSPFLFPGAAGVGTHTITYTITTSGCSNAATQPITVDPIPFAAMLPFADLCEGAPAFALTGGVPSGGAYSGTGVSAGNFDPAVAGPGTHTISYIYSNTCGADTATETITIHPIPTVTLAVFAPACEENPAFALSGGSPVGGTYFGTAVSSGNFDPGTAGAGTFSIGYAFTDVNGCGDTAFQNLTVNPTPVATLSPFSAICAGASAFTLTGGSPVGGTYFGLGVSAGVFDPTVAGPGTHAIGYAFSDVNGCSDTATQNILVDPLPTVSLTAFSAICEEAGTITLSGGSPVGGAYFGTGVSSGQFDPTISGSGTFSIGYSFTNAGGCSDTAFQNLTVNPTPTVTFGALTAVCQELVPFALSGGAPVGGTYFGSGVSAGQFDPGAAGAGTHNIGYAFADGNGCSDTAFQSILVHPTPTVTLSPFANVCVSATAITLTGGSPLGGAYFGTGVSAGFFDPAVAGVGSFTISYAFTDGNGCSDTAIQSIAVDPPPTVTLSPFTAVCQEIVAFALTGGSPAGGTYFGTGVSVGQFSPGIAGAGTFSIGYAITNGAGCSDTAFQNITVHPTPSATLTAFAAVCINGATVTLSGGSPAGGVYFGTGIIAGVFDPATAGTGTHNINYAFTDGNGCSDTATQTIVVNSAPVVTQLPLAFPSGSICLDAAPLVLAGGSPTGGTYSGAGVSGGQFDPAVAGLGLHVITYSFTDGNGCSGSATANITVDTLPTVSLAALTDVCEGAGLVTLSGGAPVGGTYFGPGVSAGSFDPVTAGVGTHLIGYAFTDGNGCSDTVFQNIVVNPVPTVTFAPLASVCVDAAPVPLSAGSPFGGNYFGSGVSVSSFFPAVAGVGTHLITYIYQDANGCSDTATQNIVVHPLPVVTFTPPANICANAPAITLTGGSPIGGTYFGSGVSSGQFDPLVTGVGTHSIGYTFSDGNGCIDTALANIVVDTLPTIGFAPFADICANAPAISLAGATPLGGTYFGTGVTGGGFDPAVTGVGTHSVGYTFTDGNGCSDTAFQNIVVNALPVVTMAPLANICEEAAPITLTGGSPAGGTYFGTGVTVGDFDPGVAGVGTHTISYAFVDGNGCSDTATTSIVVDPTPTVTLAGFTSVCVDAGSFTLMGGSPLGGTYFGTGITAGTFDPATAGVGNHLISYAFSDGNGCSDTATQTIAVDTLPTVTLVAFADICVQAAAVPLGGGTPAGGVYFGPGVIATMFDPGTAGVGAHLIGYAFTDGNGCSDTAMAPITVNPTPVVTLAALSPVCEENPAFVLVGGSPVGGTYLGTGVVAGSFDPGAAGAGSHIISYGFVDINGCNDTAVQTIVVNPTPVVTLSPFSSLCIDAGMLTLTGGSPAGGTYFGSGVNTGQFDPVVAGTGSHTISYAFSDGNGCSDTATQPIVVDTLPVVALAPLSSICENAGVLTLTGGTPVGGTYSGTGVAGGDFDPALAGLGTHLITYVFSDGNGCADSASQTIQVDSVPAVTLGAFAAICENGGSFALSGGAPVGGTYFGTGVSGGNFDPAIAGAGTHVISYTFSDGNGCSNTATQNILVDTIPVVTLAPLSSVCADAASFTLTGGSPVGGTYSGPGVTAGVFDPQIAGIGVHTISYIFADGNTCADTATQTISVDTLPVVTHAALGNVCGNSPVSTLSGGSPTGGVYSGVGVVGGTMFDPTIAGIGTQILTYVFTDGNGCVDSTTQTISVDTVPVVSLGAFSSVCANEPAFLLTGGDPLGGVFSGLGVTSGDTFNPIITGPGVHPIAYSFVDGNGCTDSSFQSMTVDTLPTVNFQLADSIFCIDDTLVTLNTGFPLGGTYSGVGVDTGKFNPVLAGIGVHPITYSVTDGNGCVGETIDSASVNGLPVVTFDPLSNLCANEAVLPLTGGNPLGGIYSGAGVTSGEFDPMTFGPGTSIVLYTYTDTLGCADTASQSITVDSVTLASFTAVADLCKNEDVVILTEGSPAPGTYFGTGITGASFDPSLAGAGSQNIGYVHTNSFGCSDTAFQSITVNPIPLVTLPAFDALCLPDASLNLDQGAPAGGVYSGQGVTGNTFNGSGLGAGDYAVSYVFVDGAGCSDSVTQDIEVRTPPQAMLGNDTTVCIPGVVELTPGGQYSSYLWNDGTTTATNSITIVQPIIGTVAYSVEVTDTAGCSGSDTVLLSTLECNQLSVYPNPSLGRFIVKVNLATAQDMEFLLVNNLGQIIRVDNISLAAGENEFPLDITDEGPGAYSLRLNIKGVDAALTTKIIVQ